MEGDQPKTGLKDAVDRLRAAVADGSAIHADDIPVLLAQHDYWMERADTAWKRGDELANEKIHLWVDARSLTVAVKEFMDLYLRWGTQPEGAPTLVLSIDGLREAVKLYGH